MKYLALVLLISTSQVIRAQSADNLHKLSYTVTYKDGARSDGRVAFLIDDPVSLPIELEGVGLCVLEFKPVVEKGADKAKSFTSGIFSIKKLSDTPGAEMKQIFYAYVPAEPHGERQLVKVLNQTITIQITKPEPEGAKPEAKKSN